MFTCIVIVFFLTLVFGAGAADPQAGFAQSATFAAVVSSALLAVFLSLASLRRENPIRYRKTLYTVAGFVLVDFALGALIGLPGYFWWSALFLILALAVIRSQWKWRMIVAIGLGATLAGYLVAAAFFVPTYRSRLAMRAKFPVESLHDRLAYDRPASQAAVAMRTSGSKSPAAIKMVDEFEGRLAQQKVDEVLDASTAVELHGLGARGVYRERRVLADTHAGFVREFINAIGFGPMRLVGVRIEDAFLVLPPPQSIPLPDVKPAPRPSDSPVAPASPLREPDQRIRGPLRHLHLTSAVDFANQGGFGFSVAESRDPTRKLELWVGFQSHGFRKPPEDVRPLDQSGVVWRLKSLELVSLLKQETPRVYSSKNLPRMQELNETPTRALDPFETRAVSGIKNGEPLVFEQDDNHLRMMGPLRAAQQCTECHNAERNDLLGAFSYQFVRHPALREPKQTVSVF